MRFHHHRQEWLSTPAQRRWQRLHFYWPNGLVWRGVGVTINRHEFSIGI